MHVKQTEKTFSRAKLIKLVLAKLVRSYNNKIVQLVSVFGMKSHCNMASGEQFDAATRENSIKKCDCIALRMRTCATFKLFICSS